MIKNALEEFANVQKYIKLIVDKEKEKVLYEELKFRYYVLKAFLTNAGMNLTDIDQLKL